MTIKDYFPLFSFWPRFKKPIVLAHGETEDKGDYKYGLRLTQIDNDEEPEYDEDPFLTVY